MTPNPSASSSNPSSSKRLRRFFYSESLKDHLPGELLRLSPAESRHMMKTIRLKLGDYCLLADGKGYEYMAMIHEESPAGVVLKIEKKISSHEQEKDFSETGLQLKLFVGCPQRGKMDFIIEKLQELGVSELVPLMTSFSMMRYESKDIPKVVGRWTRIAQEALKQSGSGKLLKIHEPVKFQKVVEEVKEHEFHVLFHPDAFSTAWNEFKKQKDGYFQQGKKVHIWIGPEGGFSDPEVETLRQKKAHVVHLGKTLLKVDTACMVAVALSRF